MVSQMNTPAVSVVMPSYNAEAFLDAAIASVLKQTMGDLELIIIDDCSTDGSYRLAKAWEKRDPRVKAMRNEINLGVARTRNKGIGLARGQCIAFLDSDDIWLPEKLRTQLEKLEDRNAQICYCSYGIIGTDGLPVRGDYLVPGAVDYPQLLKENCMQCSAMLIRAEVVRQFLFNPDYFHEDYILGLDMLRAGYRAVGCREVLLQWRYQENSRSFDKRNAARNRWRIYRKYLKLPIGTSMWVFANYAAAGLRKYRRKYESGDDL